MKTDTILIFSIIFLAGFLVSNILAFYISYGSEIPLLKDFGLSNNINKNAPTDFISEKDIEIYPDRVIIYVNNSSVSRYAATGSMKPTLDDKSNGIRIIPESEKEINVGDIITFEDSNSLIIHRVVEKGIDNEGVFFITKGDNNNIDDGKIRFKDIRYKTIAIIY